MIERRPNRVLGPGHDAFWSACAREELRLPRCSRCALLAWPIVDACPRCGDRRFVWERLSGRGTVASWCAFEQDYYRGLFPLPWACILVQLDEGPLFVSNLVSSEVGEPCLDMPVRVTFLDCEDDAGSFKLPLFRPDVSMGA